MKMENLIDTLIKQHGMNSLRDTLGPDISERQAGEIWSSRKVILALDEYDDREVHKELYRKVKDICGIKGE